MDRRRLKLLFVIDHLSSGGAQRQLVFLAGLLTRRGHQVEVVTYHRHDFFAEELKRSNVKLTEFPKAWRYSPSFIGSLRRLIRRESYDAALSFLTASNFYCLMARKLSGVGLPVIISERSASNNPNRGWRESLVERFYYLADALVLNSHHLREYYAERYPRLVGRMATIWNGVELETFAAVPMPADESLNLVAVGQLGRFKHPELVIRALGILRAEHGITAHLTWFVRRYPNLTAEEDRYMVELNALLRSTGVEQLWTWRAETDRLARELSKFHALVHASTVEGLPNAVCEALATGRPVIASNVLDHPRLVEDRRTGFLFRAGDPESLAGALASFANLNAADRQSMGSAARLYAETHLSGNRFASDYEALFYRHAKLRDS